MKKEINLWNLFLFNYLLLGIYPNSVESYRKVQHMGHWDLVNPSFKEGQIKGKYCLWSIKRVNLNVFLKICK